MPHRSVRGPAITEHDPKLWTRFESEAMKSVVDKVRAVAPTRATVLLTGETGVGKGELAKLIHCWSNRSDKPFVAVHCGALAETLLESELFGHEKGSFTGAERRRLGKFEQADGGTLFLDEVGTITHAAQVKLLQVLQERRFQRVGGEEPLDVDVRVVAATNSDLSRMQREGLFRSDLFHRLNVFPIEIPRLRDRSEDLPRLVARLLERLNKLYSKRIERLDLDVERAFGAYAWPGNVRELENVLERAHILESTTRITRRHIPGEILSTAKRPAHSSTASSARTRTLAATRSEAIAAVERGYLIELMAALQGRIDASARAAGITTRQLRKLLAKYGIDKKDFKSRRPAGALEKHSL